MSATDIADRKDRNGTEEQFALDRPTGFKSLTAAVASALQNDLVTGRHLPGAKLPIVKLARDYGVSPGAVREALSRLVSENLVEFNEQRGFRAAPVSRAVPTNRSTVSWPVASPPRMDSTFIRIRWRRKTSRCALRALKRSPA